MRKFIVIGVIAAALSLMAGTTIFAQDTTGTTAWLGVALAENDGQVIIARVQAGSPANAADLLIGDVVTAFNGTAITSASDLAAQVKAAAPGDTVTLDITRNGESLSIEVTLGSTASVSRSRRGWDWSPVDALTAAEYLLGADLQETDGGFEVVSARRSSVDLQADDIVTTINGQAAAELNLETLMSELASAGSPELTVQVVRDGEEITLTGSVFGGHMGFDRRNDSRDRDGGRRGGFDFSKPGTAPEATPESTGQA